MEQYNGFKTGVWGIPPWSSAYESPFLEVEKEEVCDKTGGSCMAFRLIRRESQDLLDIRGHITDADGIVFLYVDIRKEGIDHSFPQKRDIERAILEIRAIVPSPEQNQHTEGVSSTS